MAKKQQSVEQRIIAWFLSGDTGVSSETIVSVMTSQPLRNGRDGYPHDSGDFGRCYRLLQLVPEFRERLGEMSKTSPSWTGLVKHWPMLEGLYVIEEGIVAGRKNTNDAIRMLNTAYDCAIADLKPHMRRIADLTMNRTLSLFMSVTRGEYPDNAQWVAAVREKAVEDFKASGAEPSRFLSTRDWNPLIRNEFRLDDSIREPSIIALAWAIEMHDLRPKIQEVIARRQTKEVRRARMA